MIQKKSELKYILLISIFFPLLSLVGQEVGPFPEPRKVELTDELGRGVQRFMKRLEESTPDHKNTVRVLFYGQSITEQKWAKEVSDDLLRRYPNVHFKIENRAIGGFASDLLVQTSEADLYPFYPDLLIFYDYGRHDCYEDMIRRTRERTTAEILLQTDHLNNEANLNEETNPSKLTMENWSSWFPNVWIPTMASKYQTGMVQQRALWKIYCRDNQLDPRNLTVDGTHLNDQGNFLMAKLVSAYLVRRPQYDNSQVENEVRNYSLGKDLQWNGNKLVFPFTGNKIDIICTPTAKGEADVLIDGKRPSEFSELYQPTRVSGYPGIGWPIIRRVDHLKPQLVEDWKATATDFSSDGKHFKFNVCGSLTGPDGEGNSDQDFVSKSGRVEIKPEYWNISSSFGLLRGPWAKNKNEPEFVIPKEIVATWKIVPFFADVYSTPTIPNPAVETVIVLAQGLSNGSHELQLIGKADRVEFKALRVYQPPLTTSDEIQNAEKSSVNVPTFAPPLRKEGNLK